VARLGHGSESHARGELHRQCAEVAQKRLPNVKRRPSRKQLPGVTLPFGTSGNLYDSGLTLTGDAFLIWGDLGGAPLVGVPEGYTSGAPISSFMSLAGQTIAGMSLIPGSYTFDLPNDTITLEIGVPEPAT
jgi:hypothetical protein